MTELLVKWQKDEITLNWHEFLFCDLQDIKGAGVYLIWHTGANPRVVYIGQGEISERLAEHRGDSRILRYTRYGTLLTSGAILEERYRKGVERFLIDSYTPLVNVRDPTESPISVNLLVR